MGIGTILIGLALFIIVVLLIVLPLLEQRSPAVEPLSRRWLLQAERDSTIRNIRELDLDYRTRKLNEDDYKVLREAQVQRGAQILRELDALVESDSVDAAIEAEVLALRDSPESCPRCGTLAKLGDQFCAHCGQPLRADAAIPHAGSECQ